MCGQNCLLCFTICAHLSCAHLLCFSYLRPSDIVCTLRSLTDEPDTNDTITLFVTAFGLEGNTIDVEPLLQYDKGVHNLTRANYGHQYQTRINVTGTLLRLPLQLCGPC